MTMEPGNELDVCILEKVFGFPAKKVFKPYEESEWLYFIPSGKPRRTHMIDAKPVPRFSRDIAAAWQVVERMHKQGFWCQMRTPFEADDASDFWAGFTPHSTTGWNGRPDYWTQATTMPHAICLAALACIQEQTNAL
jgi:hypothetical protein